MIEQPPRGIALIVVLIAISVFSALGLGLALSSATARMAHANYADGVAMLNVAESALELAARDLAATADWDRALDGTSPAIFVDGAPGGTRTIAPGAILDLDRLTNELTCGRATTCSDAAIRASSIERPWGANNPRWRLFLHTPLPSAVDDRRRDIPYAIVWLGDDARETDGDPMIDGGGAAADGRYMLRARSEAFGAGGARRAIEADFTRVCRPGGAGEVCLPGIRVQSWRVVSAAVP